MMRVTLEASPALSRSFPLSWFALDELVTGGGVKVEMVDLFQIGNEFERFVPECRLPFEGMQDDAFNKVAEREVMILGQRFHNLQNSFFNADARLDAFDSMSFLIVILVHMYQFIKHS